MEFKARLSQGSTPPLNGDGLRGAFEAGTRCLERNRDAINALNVFPVPDGDTGTNMLLTMRSVNQESLLAPGSTAGEVMAAMAHGALLGARGNSGVILSQFFQGFSQALKGKDVFDAEDLARAFSMASRAADGSVGKPVEGTMLTVVRSLSLAASEYVSAHGDTGDVITAWRVSLESAKEALSRTPEQLPVLREAGVVDAGGQGVVTILEGAGCYLEGGKVEELELQLCLPFEPGIVSTAVSASASGASPAVQEEYLAAAEDELYGYCTQFLIQGHGLDVDAVRGEFSDRAESVVVVGNEALLRVHVHTHDPGRLISYAVGIGAIGQVSIENIDQQHKEFASLHRSRRSRAATAEAPEVSSAPLDVSRELRGGEKAQRNGTAVIAVAPGDGFIRLFNELGCGNVVSGGQTMNPSTQELLDAAMQSGASDVILLPNNPNVIPASLQAASIANQGKEKPSEQGEEIPEGVKLEVVRSRTLPQGLAALLAFNPELSVEDNLRSMEAALGTAITIEVTTAVRSSIVSGLVVAEGQYIGLLEGDLVVAGDSALSVLEQTLSKAMEDAESRGGPVVPEVVTLYWGSTTDETHAREAEARLRQVLPRAEIQALYGGQPYYDYIASLE